MKNVKRDRSSERGEAGLKFLIVFAILVIFANAGYNYVPVAYEGENFKSEMQTAVVNGLALPGRVNPIDNVKNRIQRAATDNNIPADMVLEVVQSGPTITAHAAYMKPVNILPFGIYRYNYQFDYTAIPAGFLLKDSK
jgi:hypothetical protein